MRQLLVAALYCTMVLGTAPTYAFENARFAALTASPDEKGYTPIPRVQLSESSTCAKRNNACSGTCVGKDAGKSCKTSNLGVSGNCSCQ